MRLSELGNKLSLKKKCPQVSPKLSLSSAKVYFSAKSGEWLGSIVLFVIDNLVTINYRDGSLTSDKLDFPPEFSPEQIKHCLRFE